MKSNQTPVQVRETLVESLRLDLIGPTNDHPFAEELLPEPPQRWYLTGMLVPTSAPLEERSDPTSSEEIEGTVDTQGTDDAAKPDRGAARRSVLPSSMGLSVLVPAKSTRIQAIFRWGDYVSEAREEGPATGAAVTTGTEEQETGSEASGSTRRDRGPYRRIPREASVTIPIEKDPSRTTAPKRYPLAGHTGIVISVTVRPVSDLIPGADQLPAGTRSVSVFVVNERLADSRHPYQACVFQGQLTLEMDAPFVPRPDLRGESVALDEWDEKVADLHYRDVFEYAVGHGVSATWTTGEDGACHRVESVWVPEAEVERVAPAAIPGAELRMEVLGALGDGASAAAALLPLVDRYRSWIKDQHQVLPTLSGSRRDTGAELLTLADGAARRMASGIELLKDATILDAFRIANRSMAAAARQRVWIDSDRSRSPADLPAPAWRPFQLAFFLQAIEGIADPLHADREVVDLLFFPTGGGKTEAYLGLAAFTMVLRRLRNPGIQGAGISVLMRYTLRLLTLDQLGRASALMCALETERLRDPATLGDWPFEIGLWVGQGATPNRLGHEGDKSPGRVHTAYTKWMAFRRDPKHKPSPIPIESCPWCGSKFGPESFWLEPNSKSPTELRVLCVEPTCPFSGDRSLPIVGVDEPIYRRLPAFLIATVDKFAALPWTGETGALFGRVDRHDGTGFYGPCSTGRGAPLGRPLLPPDLIIQDELHLISGPLGTIAGLYEAAIDLLATRKVDGKRIRPKIVASTATVRRASDQIRALFDRPRVDVFPPPGPDRRDSFFARTLPASESPARLYVGVAAQGRSLKVLLLRTALAVMSAAQTASEANGGRRNPHNPADPYLTLLGYFNSLRELGGSRRIVEDEVSTRLAQYSRRRRLEPAEALFSDRKIDFEVLELTSRESTNKVAEAKHRLSLPFSSDQKVDVALATNMISVGLDITRLGLMLVLGQPKTCAEYIQATSRVGRDPARPGLVVNLMNIHKPRDRSHYERFESFHCSFYRAVEATSVTPFSPRAMDRALAGALVGLSRLCVAEMTPPLGASRILEQRASLDELAQAFADRARNHSGTLPDGELEALAQRVLHRCRSLLDDWVNLAEEFRSKNVKLQYQEEKGDAQRLLYEFLHRELAVLPEVHRRFRANRSMRDVEASVDLEVKNLDAWEGGR